MMKLIVLFHICTEKSLVHSFYCTFIVLGAVTIVLYLHGAIESVFTCYDAIEVVVIIVYY